MTQRIRSSIREARIGQGWSQERLARAVGIARQSYAAIESGASVPATDVALRLARALSTTVEALFCLPGDAASTVEVEAAGATGGERYRVRVVGVGEKLVAFPLFGGGSRPMESADGWGVATGDGRMRVELIRDPDPDGQLVSVGCDPAFGLVAEALRRGRGSEILWSHQSSRRALEMLAAGHAHVAGVHLLDPAGGGYNESWIPRLVPFPCTRIRFAVWMQDILVPAGNPRGIRGVADLARPDVRFLNRETGSGTRMLLDARLEEAGLPPEAIPGYLETAARSHMAVGEAVASGIVDAGVGIHAAASAFGIEGVPLCQERYDLVIPDHFLDLIAVQRLLDVLRGRSVREQVESLGGYDVSGMGEPL